MPTRVSTLHELAKRTARLAGPLQPLSSSILTEAAATITPIDNLRFQRRGDDEVSYGNCENTYAYSIDTVPVHLTRASYRTMFYDNGVPTTVVLPCTGMTRPTAPDVH